MEVFPEQAHVERYINGIMCEYPGGHGPLPVWRWPWT